MPLKECEAWRRKGDYVFPDDHRRPDLVYDDAFGLDVGGVRLALMHGRGETDDATFVWLPQKRILLSGDFVIWVFPNAARTLDEILHRVRAPKRLLEKPYLLPRYDDPEFVVRNIWHLLGGWYDGNPSHLKPARDAELAAEIAALAGGPEKLVQRAAALASDGQTRLAAHLIEFAVDAAPDDAAFHRVRAEVYAACVATETSPIGKAIFAVAQRDSKARSEK